MSYSRELIYSMNTEDVVDPRSEQSEISEPSFSEDEDLLRDVFGPDLQVNQDSAFVNELIDRPDAEEESSSDSSRDRDLPEQPWRDEDDANEVDITGRLTKKLRENAVEQTISREELSRRLQIRQREIAGYEEEEEEPAWARPRPRRPRVVNARQSAKVTRLQPHHLRAERLTNLNAVDPSVAPITAVDFHRTSKLAAVASLDCKLRIFQADGRHNPKLQSVHLADLPPRWAAFDPDGTALYAAGRRRHWYRFDLVRAEVQRLPGVRHQHGLLPSLEVGAMGPEGSGMAGFAGGDGYVYVQSCKTNQLVSQFKAAHPVSCLSFHRTGRGQMLLRAGGRGGGVTTWDMRHSSKPLHFLDRGSTLTCGIACADGTSSFATGQDSGVVNVYQEEITTPVHEVSPLVTASDVVTWHPTGQLLFIASSKKRDAARMVHAATGTVYQDWPGRQLPVQYPSAAAFSPDGKKLAVGNQAGRVMMMELPNFS
eukprot:gnl/Dysnectes_brevis/3565_a4532_853.p1 GENE.gnl/Dysnectes_brevis/3565_a4532_853~~gnl/Dysnectes_brevis/3565_a4532_853.p1  ORF type:complete len:483 (+),score=144.91 gnl/Dysnectes_brevis/3565_a4532_853:22-1470(+)